MYWLKQLILIPILMITLCFKTFANETKPAEGGHGEAKKSENGSTSEVEKSYSGVQSDQWTKAQKDVQTAKIKLENDKKVLEELKKSAELQENLSKESLAKINEATKVVKTSEVNYQRLLNQYNLRFPEKGLDVGRKYERSAAERDGIENVEEKPHGVEAKLRRLNRNIKLKYLSHSQAESGGKGTQKSQKKKQNSGESHRNQPQTESNDVTEQITIEK